MLGIKPPIWGLSPLARGNRLQVPGDRLPQGPIPARAGEPHRRAEEGEAVWAYPRSRGGTSFASRSSCEMQGLSPLARGNPEELVPHHRDRGPIPARAGEPISATAPRRLRGAYPRSRGGTDGSMSNSSMRQGLSPLARGNLIRANPEMMPVGPIPARAGEPRCPHSSTLRRGAYPRSRGGTACKPDLRAVRQGLSPLARGEPPARRLLAVLMAAYPRSRGGTKSRAARYSGRRGLSPLARGEPAFAAHQMAFVRAYPRSRGGTSGTYLEESFSQGLSPLARGNQCRVLAAGKRAGPIPARAGEPVHCLLRLFLQGAYPRSRGGTPDASAKVRRVRGLSPLARGNRAGPAQSGLAAGPIPARAGEPL